MKTEGPSKHEGKWVSEIECLGQATTERITSLSIRSAVAVA